MNKYIEKKKLIFKTILAFVSVFFEIIAFAMLFTFMYFLMDLRDSRMKNDFSVYYTLISFFPVIIFRIILLGNTIFYIKKSKQANDTTLIILYSLGILIIPVYIVANIIYIKKYLNDKTIKKEAGNNMTEAEFQKPNSVEVTYVTASYKTDKFKKFQDRMSNNSNNDEKDE